MGASASLDAPLMRLAKGDYFTLRDACQGVLITGGTGSGKTSGSGQSLAGAYLRAGMGGLVLVAKPEEADLWRRYCKMHGRSNSLIEIDGSNGEGFNFLAYELARQGPEGVNSVVECIMRIVEASRVASGSSSRGGEQFWEDTTRQLLRNTIPILYAATGRVSIPEVIAAIRSGPRSREEATQREWQQRAMIFQAIDAAARKLGDNAPLVSRTASYWFDDFATLDDRTRGNIAISLTTILDRFNHGWLNNTFCGRTTVVPELSFHGAIILLNMPALTRNEDGIIAQHLFKYMWQRAVLARNALASQHRTRPVFLWADEAQYFINAFDAEYLSTSRGSLGCTVFLSQSLPTYYARIGGENARDRVHHLLGNFGTKVWHSNSCAETNEWAARTIGRGLQWRDNYSQGEGSSFNNGMGMNEGTNWGTNTSSGSSYSSSSNGGSTRGSNFSSGVSSGGNDGWSVNRGSGSSYNQSWGGSQQMDYLIEPAEFGRMLKTGGRANRNHVTGVWYQAGRQFHASGQNILLADFEQ